MGEIYGEVGIDGVRMSMNILPRADEAEGCAIPFAVLIEPIRHHTDILTLNYEPICCTQCHGVLNPFCNVDFSVDYTRRRWVCPMCKRRNTFPSTYANVPEHKKLCTTVEYTCNSPILAKVMGLEEAEAQRKPPVFLFILDTCMNAEKFESAKSALIEAIELLPRNAFLGFISCGTNVLAHELEHEEGDDGLTHPVYFSAASNCRPTIFQILNGLHINEIQPPNEIKPPTRLALLIAASLLKTRVPGSGARIVAFVGGRSAEVPMLPWAAVQFYEKLSEQLVSQGHVLDLFAAARDEAVVAEMKVVIEKTGGVCFHAQSFNDPDFRAAVRHVFDQKEGSLGLAFNATLMIICSADLNISRIIGPCTSLKKNQTVVWKLCGLDKSTCLTVFFDISSKTNPSGNQNPQLYIQILTSYQDIDGLRKLRATTLARRWVRTVGSDELMRGFDQKTAAVVMAKLTNHNMEMEQAFDVRAWLRETLVSLHSEFGGYGIATSEFTLKPQFSEFTQFMLNLLRSEIVQVADITPGRMAYIRLQLNRSNLTRAALMLPPPPEANDENFLELLLNLSRPYHIQSPCSNKKEL